jgi:hypothetical protein
MDLFCRIVFVLTVFPRNFFLCVLGCFFDLGFAEFAGHVQKRLETYRKVWKSMKKVQKGVTNPLIKDGKNLRILKPEAIY